MTDEEILLLFQSQFGSTPRPDKFTCEDGDPECMDHDATLHSWTPESLTLEDVTHIGYDPWSECLPQGKAYFLPVMVRLALEQPAPDIDEWYAGWLGHRLGYDADLFNFCNPGQRNAMLGFLDHLLATRKEIAEDQCCLADLINARDHLKQAINDSDHSV